MDDSSSSSSRAQLNDTLTHSKSLTIPIQHPINGDLHLDQSESHSRLPSPTDDSSRMSFSSTSNDDSPLLSHHNGSMTIESNPNIGEKLPNGTTIKRLEREGESTGFSLEIDGQTSIRDQEIQRYYRADLIQHLTDWSSTQFEKQVSQCSSRHFSL